MALTPQQERFVQEYLVDLNATQAAIRAGYSERTAQEQSSRLLSKAMVREAVDKGKQNREKRTAITQDWALERLRLEAENTGKGSSHAARVTAIGLAMKHLGMMTEDRPHPDSRLPDLSGLTRDDLDRLLTILRPLFAPASVAGG